MQIKTNHGIKLAGIYPGQVVQHLSGGKCKVFIPGVYPDRCIDNPSELPDAEQAAPLFGGINKGNGCFSYPNIGAIVWCMFQNGDQNLPVYFAARLGGELAVSTPDEGFQLVRDNVSPSDNPEEDTTKNGWDSYQHMINCGNSRVIIRETGQIHIICKNNDDSDEEAAEKTAEIFIDEDGFIEIHGTQSIQVTAPAIAVNAEDELQIDTTTLVIRANNEIQINAPQVTSVNENSFNVISPSINMDASAGKFTAKGATHSPIFLT